MNALAVIVSTLAGGVIGIYSPFLAFMIAPRFSMARGGLPFSPTTGALAGAFLGAAAGFGLNALYDDAPRATPGNAITQSCLDSMNAGAKVTLSQDANGNPVCRPA